MNLAPLFAGVLGPLWTHLQDCQRCNPEDGLCAEGQRAADEATGRMMRAPRATLTSSIPAVLRAIADELEG